MRNDIPVAVYRVTGDFRSAKRVNIAMTDRLKKNRLFMPGNSMVLCVSFTCIIQDYSGHAGVVKQNIIVRHDLKVT
jgi:hypothetical protein